MPGDKVREYYGHAMHCKDAKFSSADGSIVSIGGNDCTIIQWRHVDLHGKVVQYDNSVTPRKPTIVRSPKSSHRNSQRRTSTTYQVVAQSELAQKLDKKGGKVKKGGDGVSRLDEGEEKKEEPKRPVAAKTASFPRDVTALFNYDANDDDELSFKAGDVIRVLKEQDGWLSGKFNGKRGILPANYVE